MSNDPPEAVRTTVRHRASHRCERCEVPAPNGHLHHRRSRSVRDQHCHCACNLVWLCGTCHAWAHAHPWEAREAGWIVSRHVTEPTAVTLATIDGDRVLHCDGQFTVRF